MIHSEERNKAIFEFAQKYLISVLPQGMTPSDLDKYYLGDRKEAATLKEVYIEFLSSAQEYQRMALNPSSVCFCVVT